mmetsp:Transcript_1489/g.4832  ORF Transcript_1489/g.4832 Transcript_1489/m.4832 type:complete len:223 (-) Transcript_1489:22-690(-)
MNRLATPFQNIYKRIVSSIARRCGGPMRTSTRRKFPFCFVVTWCLSHASTTTPGRLTRARELDTDVRFSLFDRNADGRLGGDEVTRILQLVGISAEGSEQIFQAALAYTESEDLYLSLDELREWDTAMVAAFDEASRDGRVTLEEGSEVLMETLNLQLTPADVRQLGKNRDSNIDGILTPTELFPGSISAGPGTADENQEDGALASSVSFVVSSWLLFFSLL